MDMEDYDPDYSYTFDQEDSSTDTCSDGASESTVAGHPHTSEEMEKLPRFRCACGDMTITRCTTGKIACGADIHCYPCRCGEYFYTSPRSKDKEEDATPAAPNSSDSPM